MLTPDRKYSNGGSYRYGFNGQEKSNEINDNLTTAEFWEYDSRIVRRWNVDPKPTVAESPYLCFKGNPICFSDIRGDTARGVSKDDAKFLRDDIKESLAGDNFKRVRDLIKIDKDKKSISGISQGDLDIALEGIKLSPDEKGLLNNIVNTINSKQVHLAEYKEGNEWISNVGLKALQMDLSYWQPSLVSQVTGIPESEIERGNVPANAILLFRGAATCEYNGGSYSLMPKKARSGPNNDYFNKNGTPTTNPLDRPTMHEVFGHGRSLALKIADQHTPIIQWENLVLRVMKKDVSRDGTNHDNGKVPGGKVENKDEIPAFVNQKE